jgi:hypothetical protein
MDFFNLEPSYMGLMCYSLCVFIILSLSKDAFELTRVCETPKMATTPPSFIYLVVSWVAYSDREVEVPINHSTVKVAWFSALAFLRAKYLTLFEIKEYLNRLT